MNLFFLRRAIIRYIDKAAFNSELFYQIVLYFSKILRSTSSNDGRTREFISTNFNMLITVTDIATKNFSIIITDHEDQMHRSCIKLFTVGGKTQMIYTSPMYVYDADLQQEYNEPELLDEAINVFNASMEEFILEFFDYTIVDFKIAKFKTKL